MFYNFNKLINESLSFYGFNNVNNGHEHRNEKGYTDEDPNYRRKHLNMVPDYVKKSQNTAVEKIRSLNYDKQTFQMLSNIEAQQIIKKYGINIDNLKKQGQARLGRSKSIIVYNPVYKNFYIKKEIKLNEK